MGLVELELKLREKLEFIILNLDSPLPNYELEAGWLEETRQRWHNNFENMLESLMSHEPLPDASIPRAMDFDGVTGGVLFELGAEISALLRRHSTLL